MCQVSYFKRSSGYSSDVLEVKFNAALCRLSFSFSLSVSVFRSFSLVQPFSIPAGLSFPLCLPMPIYLVLLRVLSYVIYFALDDFCWICHDFHTVHGKQLYWLRLYDLRRLFICLTFGKVSILPESWAFFHFNFDRNIDGHASSEEQKSTAFSKICWNLWIMNILNPEEILTVDCVIYFPIVLITILLWHVTDWSFTSLTQHPC